MNLENKQIEIIGLTKEELEVIIVKQKLAKFRASQILDWVYQKNTMDFTQMKNLGQKTIEVLEEKFTLLGKMVTEKSVLISNDKKTRKVLLDFGEDIYIESVLMQHNYGNSVCVSSQAGCDMACSFCASGLKKSQRNLTAGEMLYQVLYFQKQLLAESKGVSHIVIMGSGEPLLNYEEVLKFIKLLHEKYVFNISYRNITLSTVGIVPAIRNLARENLPINLAISLHAPNNELRSLIIPTNKKYSVQELVATAKEYFMMTKRQITYEYIMLRDFNDHSKEANELVKLLRGQNCLVNLIPANPVSESNLAPSLPEVVEEFYNILLKNKIPVTIRKEMGANINAACGQLRNKERGEEFVSGEEN